MTKPKAYGTFIKRGVNIFRTSAFIQWGESEESIGACLLRNPGGFELDKKLSATLNTIGSASGWLELEDFDETMKQLVCIVEGIYSGKEFLEGRFHIYNLFNLRNTKSGKATDEFEELVDSGEYNITESLVTLEVLQSHPWILVGWGIEQKNRWQNLLLIKEKWMDLIFKSKVPFFGSKKDDEYYHACPLNRKERPIRANELIKIYKQRFGIIRFQTYATKPNILVEFEPVEENNVFAMFENGWSKSYENPESIVLGFSHLRIKEGYKLRAYQYISGGNGNGVVWAIPTNKELPKPEEEVGFYLKPDFALIDFMEVIEGDRTPMSYLQASIVFHELHEFGAMWHGVSWGRDVILPINDNKPLGDYEWDMHKREPEIIEPNFYYNKDGNPVIVFHTINDIGTVSLNRYVHVFSKDNYTMEVAQTCIATASGGIIF